MLLVTPCFFMYFFTSPKKSTKKGARQKITSLLSEGALIRLLYYCKLEFGSLIFIAASLLRSFHY